MKDWNFKPGSKEEKQALKAQDDGSLQSIFKMNDGKFYKLVNTYPYIHTEITEGEFNSYKSGLVRVNHETHGREEILEMFSKL